MAGSSDNSDWSTLVPRNGQPEVASDQLLISNLLPCIWVVTSGALIDNEIAMIFVIDVAPDITIDSAPSC